MITKIRYVEDYSEDEEFASEPKKLGLDRIWIKIEVFHSVETEKNIIIKNVG